MHSRPQKLKTRRKDRKRKRDVRKRQMDEKAWFLIQLVNYFTGLSICRFLYVMRHWFWKHVYMLGERNSCFTPNCISSVYTSFYIIKIYLTRVGKFASKLEEHISEINNIEVHKSWKTVIPNAGIGIKILVLIPEKTNDWNSWIEHQ